MNQNLCRLEKATEDRDLKYRLWLKERSRAIDAWIKFMMPDLYKQNKVITKALARIFGDMCLKEGRLK